MNKLINQDQEIKWYSVRLSIKIIYCWQIKLNWNKQDYKGMVYFLYEMLLNSHFIPQHFCCRVLKFCHGDKIMSNSNWLRAAKWLEISICNIRF